MMDENKEILPEELVEEVVEEQNDEASSEDVVEEQSSDSEAVEDTTQKKDNINWKNLREEKDRVQRERDEAVALLRQIENQVLSEQKKAKEAPSNEFDDLDADDYIPRSYVDKKYKELRREVEEYKKTNYERTVESQMKAQFSDFDEIVSHDNIKKLKDAYPEIASSIASNSDLGSRAKAAYTVIKKLGISSGNQFGGEK